MTTPNTVIIGLGRIGSAFLGAILERRQRINLLCVAELADTPAKRQAKKAGIPTASIDDIIAMGDKIDIIFDLTGIPDVRRELREKLVAAKNDNTVIASETIARFIWSLISDDELPLIEGRKMGY
jgi:predicted dehydrogenase